MTFLWLVDDAGRRTGLECWTPDRRPGSDWDVRRLLAPPVCSDRFYRIEFDAAGAFRKLFPEGADWNPNAVRWHLRVSRQEVGCLQEPAGAGKVRLRPFVRGPGPGEERIPRAPFSFSAGYADLSLWAELDERLLEVQSSPVAVYMPSDSSAKAVAAMADRVARGWERWFSLDGVREETGRPSGRRTAGLRGRVRLLEDVLRVFEATLPYFRANARFRLEAHSRIDRAGKLRGVSAATLRHVVSHPEELRPSAWGTGIRAGPRFYAPEHTLVESVRQNSDTPENRAVAGFLAALADEIRAEKERVLSVAERISGAVADMPGYVSTTQAIMDISAESLCRYAEEIAGLGRRVRELSLHYARALGVQSRPLRGIPRRTPAFSSVPAYRRVWDAMLRWRSAGELSLSRERTFLEFLDRSRLYEVYVLVRMLEDFERAGLRLTERRRFDYEGLFENFGTVHAANTFRLESPDGEVLVTVWHEPALRMAGMPLQNGVEIARVTEFGIDGDSTALSRRDPRLAVYTPDFLVRVERHGSVRWIVADAKYAHRCDVLRSHVLALVWKYLFSVAPVRPGERLESLWIFYGLEDWQETSRSSLKEQGLEHGIAVGQNVHWQHLTEDAGGGGAFCRLVEQALM